MILHWAACGGHVELVKRFIQGGCSPDEPDSVSPFFVNFDPFHAHSTIFHFSCSLNGLP